MILLHETGAYVFESKNYSGWIFGGEYDRYWAQSLPAGDGEYRRTGFLNPIRQNQGHIRWLAETLDLPEESFYSYVVFGDGCTLKEGERIGEHCAVVQQNGLYGTIRREVSRREPCLNRREIDALYEELKPGTRLGRLGRSSHVRDAQESRNRVVRERVGGVCPLCGGRLVLRTVQKGERRGEQFWGCSHYPDCRYTKPL